MYAMTKTILPMLFCSMWLSAGCSDEPEPRSVREYLDNPQFLEATVVRCARNRSQTRYDVECVNARQAVSVIEAQEERSRRDKLEAQSKSKRDALRRTQVAASEARHRAAEMIRLQEEAEYLAQFGELPLPRDNATGNDLDANVPGAAIDGSISGDSPPVVFDQPARRFDESIPASDGGNAPTAQTEPESTD
jgi:hypothetical protein